MDRELALDIAHGLVGKTAIHPNQIGKIEKALMVQANDHTDALRILNSSQAVFKSQEPCANPQPIAAGRQKSWRVLRYMELPTSHLRKATGLASTQAVINHATQYATGTDL